MKFDVIIANSAFVKENAEYFANEYSKLLSDKQEDVKAFGEMVDKEIYLRSVK